MEEKTWLPVRLTILTREEDGGEPMRLLLQGEMCRSGGEFLLRYQERMDEETPEETSVRLRVREGRVTMLRQGGFGVTMIFEAGRTHRSAYRTPYGEMPLEIATERVLTSLAEEGGGFTLVYAISAPGGLDSRRCMELTWEAVPGEG